MYLATYTFTGDPTDLAARYDRLAAMMPTDELLIHLAVRTAEGLTLIDTCPDRAAFEAFSTSEAFHGGLAAVGLPTPVVTAVGEVHAAVANAVPV